MQRQIFTGHRNLGDMNEDCHCHKSIHYDHKDKFPISKKSFEEFELHVIEGG